MKKLLSYEFNIDTARVELKYTDGSMLAIDCDAVEDEYHSCSIVYTRRDANSTMVFNCVLTCIQRWLFSFYYEQIGNRRMSVRGCDRPCGVTYHDENR